MKRIVIAVIGLVAAVHAHAETVRVATRLVEPFVVQRDGRLAGFSIELWDAIAKQLGLETRYVVEPDVADVLKAVQNDEADLGIAAISVTAEREAAMDFSQPMFDSGLQILTAPKHRRTDVVAALVEGIFSSAMLPLLGTVIVLVLVPAHLVWWWERHHPSSMLSTRAYLPGILEACWWAASTLATQADQMPRAALARIVAVLWMFASVVFVAYFTASVTSNLTLQQLHGDISGPGDLPGKRIVTITGSTSAEYLRERRLEARETTRFDEAVDAVRNGEADALVYDAPALQYYAAHGGRGHVEVVGEAFRRENYGIVFKDRSPRLKAVNGALLKLKESGAYDELYAKWFGAK